MADEIPVIPPDMRKVYLRLKRWRSSHACRVDGGEDRENRGKTGQSPQLLCLCHGVHSRDLFSYFLDGLKSASLRRGRGDLLRRCSRLSPVHRISFTIFLPASDAPMG